MAADGAAAVSESAAGDLLRLLVCGGGDDGKTALIDRLVGAGPGDERRERIAIDAADRYFSTPRRAFAAAAAPGREQDARSMASAAPRCDLALILVDARTGILPQTRRHAFLAALFGIRQITLAVDKMDLVGFEARTFERIAAAFSTYAGALGEVAIRAIPVSARVGDNVGARSARMPWYRGPSLIEHLDSVEIAPQPARPFRFPVQEVDRPGRGFPGLSGTIASGRIACGDPVLVAGTGRTARVKRIVSFDKPVDRAEEGEAVTLTLDEAIDIAGGDLLADPAAAPECVDQFAAEIIWMSAEPLVPGRSYLLGIGARTVPATVTALKHRVDTQTLAHLADKTLARNEIGFCNLSTVTPIAFDPYRENRDTGRFTLIDRTTDETVGAGLVAFGLRRASNLHWQALTIGTGERAALKGQSAAVLWLTGLSGAGKSTLADLVEKKLHAEGRHTMLLDGDNVRHGLNRDLGFTEADRVENIRRVGEVAKLMAEAGLIVICSFISPFRAERRMVRELTTPIAFLEIFVDTPIEECVRRDPKGLYAKAKAGQIANFTGIDSPYEPPPSPELRLATMGEGPERLAEAVVDALRARAII